MRLDAAAQMMPSASAAFFVNIYVAALVVDADLLDLHRGDDRAADILPPQFQKPARISRCPSAVAPPWLPIAGTINGRAADLTKSAMHLVVSATFATPREPAVMAMRILGLTREANFSSLSRLRMISGISAGSMRGRGNFLTYRVEYLRHKSILH